MVSVRLESLATPKRAFQRAEKGMGGVATTNASCQGKGAVLAQVRNGNCGPSASRTRAR